MKFRKSHRLLFCAFAVLANHFVLAQTHPLCDNFDCMMRQARRELRDKDFEGALNSTFAAKLYPQADAVAADALLKVIFKEINRLREDAEEAKRIAQASAAEAKQLADSLARTNEALKDALRRSDTLIQKGKLLEKTFSNTGAYDYLVAQGKRYFAFDSVSQHRDYTNARTYFAVARFLQPSAMLDVWVNASTLGIAADSFFVRGQLDSAGTTYQNIIRTLESMSVNPDYEKWRLENIEEVRNLFALFVRQYRIDTDTAVVLDGNWWVLPEQFTRYAHISGITFRNNGANFQSLSEVLSKMDFLQTITFEKCGNLRNIDNWSNTRHLRSITLKHNPNLYAVTHLDTPAGLKELSIDDCPALAVIEGCRSLDLLFIRKSPQARVSGLLQNNPAVKTLELADLVSDTLFNKIDLDSVENLRLSNLPLTGFRAIERSSRLRSLTIDNLDSVKSIALPGQLQNIYLKNCDAITNLQNWQASTRLQNILLFNNDRLKHLPLWKNFPNATNLLIQQNNSLVKIGTLRSLNKSEHLFVINNPKVGDNNINLLLMIDFLDVIGGAKFEFEHRRTLGPGAIGFKVCAFYEIDKSRSAPYEIKQNLFVPSLAINYYINAYTNINVYLGGGPGLYLNKKSYHHINDRTTEIQQSRNFTFVPNIGLQLSLKKGKISAQTNYFMIFYKDKNGPNFYKHIVTLVGYTYPIGIGFNKNTRFIPSNEAKKSMRVNKKKIRLEDMPAAFEAGFE